MLAIQKTMKGLSYMASLLLLAACSTNNITQDNELKKYFDQNRVEGCFGMFDNGQGQFNIYNMPRFRDSSYTPASTFKIFNALVALGTGRIFSDTVVLPWDGTVRTGPMGDTMHAWNKNMDMREAFAVSNVPFFQEMARRVGRDTMQKMLDSIGYGNKKIGPEIDRFWLDNSLKITPDEQLGLVKRLYFRQLPFQNREQELVKEMMVREKTDKYILAYKTGWGKTEKGHSIGWLVGWIEENKHPYFFVLNVESADPNLDIAAARLNIVKGILKEKGFFLGKK